MSTLNQSWPMLGKVGQLLVTSGRGLPAQTTNVARTSKCAGKRWLKAEARRPSNLAATVGQRSELVVNFGARRNRRGNFVGRLASDSPATRATVVFMVRLSKTTAITRPESEQGIAALSAGSGHAMLADDNDNDDGVDDGDGDNNNGNHDDDDNEDDDNYREYRQPTTRRQRLATTNERRRPTRNDRRPTTDDERQRRR